jgi:two-component system, sensor histidine kinase and response regulator
VAKILVIEDDPLMLDSVVQVLTLSDMEVLSAENGIDGLALAREHQPDLVVCDVSMPDLDGYGVLLELHSDPLTETIPLIFLTGHADKKSMRMGMELGADDFLVKPFTPPELLAAVNGRLDRYKTIRSQPERKLEELRGNVLHVFPHEMRTPLTAIMGYSDMLSNNAGHLSAEKVSVMAQRINKAGHRLFHMIDNFLIFSQLHLVQPDSEWANELQKIMIDGAIAYKTISDRVNFVARQYEREQDIQLTLEPISTLNVSQDSLKKMVEEMVDNACKFSEAGTAISITGIAQEDTYTICTADAGHGISAEQIAEIAPYIQFDRHQYDQQGTGLGLVIVRGLAELYQGTSEIESVVGEGTRICVTLNIAPRD